MGVTQQQIAELAGVSRGTVDRVLNNRGRVNPEIEARIRRIADELGYRPNRAGSLLVRTKRPLKLGVVMQSAETPFMQSVLHEIEDARGHMQELGAELLIRAGESIDISRQLAALDELERQKVDGIALTPVEDERICDRIDALSAAGIPTVTFNTDMPGSKRLCYVGQDNYQSGRACAGLMNMLLGGRGTVLMVTGYVSNLSQQRRIDGFRTEIQRVYPGISLLPLERCADSDRSAYEIVRKTLLEQPDVGGVFFSAGGPAGGCSAIRELGRKGRTHVICYDRTEDNIANVREGLVDFLINQDPHMQAVRPLETLLDYLLTSVRPENEYMLAHIDIRTQYNV
ncbi:LacI family DNA-binding transcriptional regulator [Agathobaculum sp.]|uniref:LacI family DNA-binding transcriptional regulator n=1 Tax=Agathobaculum sp. TaxID=2048138 RepID=UPI002A83E4A9|nr:LacI family DNA-binding transcriptional regulator [Agathobaculum sp.]MDY3618940.1 LacI family DNA-binding transcriptional regulator [Agathobaculum sp.]